MQDSYKTIQDTASAEYEEKKSRFIAQVAPVTTEAEALAFLEDTRNANPLARHNVYAYVLRENNRVRYSDDGEPAKTSGLPTLSVIEHEELKDVICVTTRYFGGVLLGTGGLVRAYTKAAQDAFAAAAKVVFAECIDVTIQIEYARYDALKHWLEQQHIQIVTSDYSNKVTVVVRVRSTEVAAVRQALTELAHGELLMHEGEMSYQPLKVE